MAEGIRFSVGGNDFQSESFLSMNAAELGVLHMGSCTWEPALADAPTPNFFFIPTNARDFVIQCAEYAVKLMEENFGKKPSDIRAALIGVDWAEYMVTPLNEALTNMGVDVVLLEMYPSDNLEFNTLVQKIKAANVDLFMPSQYVLDGSAFLTAYREANVDIPLYYGTGMFYDMQVLGDMGPEMADGILTGSWTNPSMNRNVAPYINEFVQEFTNRLGYEPLTHCFLSFASAIVLFEMIEAAGSFDVEAVNQAFRAADYDVGHFPFYWGLKFNENNYNERAVPILMSQWQNGKLVSIGPDVLKTGTVILPWDPAKTP